MNILCICYEYPPLGGGGAPACQGICESIVAAGHRMDVVTSAMPDLPMRETRQGVNLHRVKCMRRHRHYTTTLELLTGLLPAYRYAMQLTKKNQYDLIHCHFAVPSGIVARRVARKANLPYIITSHGSDIPGYNPDRFSLAHQLIKPIWRTILRDAEIINTPSHYLKGLLQSQIDVPVEIIPYGFTPPADPGVPRQNRILVVTRMFERKGVQHVIEAMRHIETDWELCIVGDGPYLPTLKTLAETTGVKAKFYGYVQGQALVDLYHSAKIFALPSSSENFPVVLLEALAAGCAVITTAGTGCAEVVGSAGITVESENPQAIREALQKLLDNEDEVDRLRQLAVNRIKNFHWDRIGHAFEQLYMKHVQAEASVQEVVSP